jgi:tetratricopeptide (TPR) repeat protein
MENDELFFLADKAIGDGKIVEAEEMLNTIIANAPNYGKAYNHLGWLYYYKFLDSEIAEHNFKLTLQHSPEYKPVYLHYSALLSEQVRIDEHKTLIDTANKFNRLDDARYNEELGVNYELRGEYNKAIDYYNKAETLGTIPNDAVITKHIERCQKKRDIIVPSKWKRVMAVFSNKI